MVRSHCTLSLAQLATIQYPWTTHVTHVLVCLQSQVHGTAASNLYTLFSSWTCCKSILAIFARAALSTIEACNTIALPCGRTLDPAMDRPGHRPRWGQHMSAAGLLWLVLVWHVAHVTLKPIKGGLQLDHLETFSVFALESAHPMPLCGYGCYGKQGNPRKTPGLF